MHEVIILLKLIYLGLQCDNMDGAKAAHSASPTPKENRMA